MTETDILTFGVVLLVAVFVAGAILEWLKGKGLFAAAPPRAPHKLGASKASQIQYLAGSAGTATVPTGFYAVAVGAYAGSAGTLVITPQGQSTSAGVAGPSMPIPAGVAWGIDVPSQMQQPNGFADGSTFVFTGTATYFVLLQQYN